MGQAGGGRVVFAVARGPYRLVVRVSYPFERVLVTFIGTREENEKINTEAV